MMVYMAGDVVDIANMPRGGPDASCLDRRLQTDRLEYLDRADVDESTKRSVIEALAWTGRVFGNTGALSRQLLEWHPTAELTVTDVEPPSARAISAVEIDVELRGGLMSPQVAVATRR